MDLSGTIEVIKETQVISEKFRKREFVINTGGDYPELIQLEMVQDKCPNLDNNQVGQVVDVSFNLKGRAWTNPQGDVKYFLTAQAWMVKVAEGAAPVAPAYQQPAPVQQQAPIAGIAGSVEQGDVPGEIPF